MRYMSKMGERRRSLEEWLVTLARQGERTAVRWRECISDKAG